MFANFPFIKKLFEKFSQQEVGADVELTSFSGVLTVSCSVYMNIKQIIFNLFQLNIPPPPSDRIW
jgi:hypothetical protein